MSELISTADETPRNRSQQAGEILRAAMQPAVEEVEETQEVTAEVETEDEVVEEQASEAIEAPEVSEQQEEESDVAIETLTDLATAIEVDNDFLYNIKVPMADGQEPVSLSELKDAYSGRLESQTNAETILEQQRVAFEQQKKEFEESSTQQLSQIQQMPEELLSAEAEVRAIAYQYNSYDWSKLEQSDPGRAALEKQNLATAYSQAEAKASDIKMQIQQQQQQEFEKMRIAHEQKLLSSITDWNDPSVRTKDTTGITTLLGSYGFNPQEAESINSFSDPRTTKMLRDYMMLKSKFDEATTVKKTVMKTPKSLKPGAPKVEPTAKRKLQAKLEAAKNSRDTRVKVSAISDLIANRGQ